jgi:site-specific recombinase XerD
MVRHPPAGTRVDIASFQRALLGHAKLTTTARYASVTGMIAAVDSPPMI